MREIKTGSVGRMTDHTAQGRIMKISVKKKEYIFYSVILIVSILFFTFVGERGYYEYPDSWQYIELEGGQGIMPVYPLFIFLHRMLLGSECYLYGVVISQTLLTIISLMLYMIWIRIRFCAGYLVSCLIYITALVPFTLDFPTVVGNHAILTEALTYPMFYLFMITFVETMIRKKLKWVCVNFVIGIVLALVRTQMQICMGFTALVFFYIIWRRSVGKSTTRKVVRALAALITCAGIILVGEIVILQINGRLQHVVDKCKAIMQANAIYLELEEETELMAANGVVILGRKQQEHGKETVKVQETTKVFSNNADNMTEQVDSVLIDRAFYEMDEDDSELFEDAETKALFLKYYEQVDLEQARYVYARAGLWKWRDIMNGTAAGASCMYQGWKNYLIENPDSPLQDWTYCMQVTRRIVFALIKAHWPRMIYHTLCMLPQGFICTVFFQKEAIYGLCHLYTMFVYTLAIVVTVLGFNRKNKGYCEKKSEFMLGILVVNVGMVVIISVIFFGMQRYLIYGFGLFYGALLLMLEEIWKLYGSTLWKRLRSRS